MSSTNKSDTQMLCKNITNVSSANALEVDTLSNMIALSKQCNKFLDSLQASRQRLIQDIKNNENDFFDKNPLILTQFNSIFDPTVFKRKVDCFAEELKDAVDNYCRHEYVEDLIDIEYDLSKRIVYCQLCELTKR